MHGHINIKSLNNTSKWHMGFNSAFKGLIGIGGWMGPRPGMDVSEKRKIVCPTGIRTSDRSVSRLITIDSLGISQQHVGFSELC
jgi:hypothetical protein